MTGVIKKRGDFGHSEWYVQKRTLQKRASCEKIETLLPQAR